jgi:DNA-binding MarR family transcriptional regulator
LLEEAGVDDEEFALLLLLAAYGPLTTKAVAAELGVPFTTASDALSRLDARGELERLPNPDDLRSHLLQLSPRGWARVDAAEPALRGAAARVRRELQAPAEPALEELLQALRKVSRNP